MKILFRIRCYLTLASVMGSCWVWSGYNGFIPGQCSHQWASGVTPDSYWATEIQEMCKFTVVCCWLDESDHSSSQWDTMISLAPMTSMITMISLKWWSRWQWWWQGLDNGGGRGRLVNTIVTCVLSTVRCHVSCHKWCQLSWWHLDSPLITYILWLGGRRHRKRRCVTRQSMLDMTTIWCINRENSGGRGGFIGILNKT